ncbi:uncharacterized protein LOC132203385 [Neocloeon triangulifer]|uniref:uncharacterized protein LOC132203385 n=1 Tax=Neocloeon triangulifer TaxID=2078957 RepID=UPI00286F7454|nr:uncharacterized protein LOC132203385 [Neocloeon triangulifer]
MQLKGVLLLAFYGLLCLSHLAQANRKDRHHKNFRDEDVENVELEPEIKTAASLSHAMLQQLTDAVRSLLPVKDQISSQQAKIDQIYDVSLEAKKYLESSKKNESEIEQMRSEISRMARKVSTTDTECSESLEYCRLNMKNALAELRQRCDSDVEAVERKWQDKMQQLSFQQGGQISEFQQGCEAQTISLQTQCFTKMMDLSTEADKTIAVLKAENEKLQAQIAELNEKLGKCVPEKSDFDYKGNVAKSAKGLEFEKVPKPTSSPEKADCEGFSEPSAPVSPTLTESGMNVGNNKQYIIGERKVTWEEANELCRAKGMWLLTQETEKDKHLLNIHIQKIIGTQPATFWMSARKEEGETWFMWQCFTTSQRPWRHTQVPKTDQRCAYVTYQKGGKGVWADDPCEDTHRYICQKMVH